MALFKIFKGSESSKLTNPSVTGYKTPVDGYAYYDTTTKLFYIDAAYPGATGITRQPINAKKADMATLANAAVYETTEEINSPLHKINTYYGHGLSLNGTTLSLVAGDNNTTLSSITLPPDTHWTTHLRTASSATATTQVTTTTSNPYLNLLDNSTVRDSIRFVGSGTTTIQSSADGKTITISSADSKTGTVTSITPGNGLLNGTTTNAITSTGTLNINYGTTTAKIGTAAAGSATTVSRSDHVHAIDLATGDNNGQVKIAGTNVSVKGLGSNAYTSTVYAPLASPALTGIPTAPTAAAGTNTTQIATTAFVKNAIATNATNVEIIELTYYDSIQENGETVWLYTTTQTASEIRTKIDNNKVIILKNGSSFYYFDGYDRGFNDLRFYGSMWGQQLITPYEMNNEYTYYWKSYSNNIPTQNVHILPLTYSTTIDGDHIYTTTETIDEVRAMTTAGDLVILKAGNIYYYFNRDQSRSIYKILIFNTMDNSTTITPYRNNNTYTNQWKTSEGNITTLEARVAALEQIVLQ